MRRIATLMMSWLCIVAIVFAAKHSPNSLAMLCNGNALADKLVAPKAFAPIPKYGDDYWKQLPLSLRTDFIKKGEEYLNTKWPSLDYKLFAEYKTNGNRDNYEQFIFEKRKKLASLVMAEIMEGEGRFLPDIAKGVQSLCDEPWWGVPAHYPKDKPTSDVQTLDLFSAETGSMAAWIYYMMGDALDKTKNGISSVLAANIQRRINDEALQKKEFWRGAANNWNPWICSNWLTCVLLIEQDREKQIKAIKEIAESLDSFIDKYPEDGACDEGASYWDKATGCLLDCLVLLDEASSGGLNIWNDDKLRKMSEYISKINIDNKNVVGFADSSPILSAKPQWFVGAKRLKSDELMSLSANAAKRVDYYNKPSAMFRSDRIPSLGRELRLLSDFDDLKKYDSQVILPFDTWLPITQVINARSFPNSKNGLYFAAKGGNNNDESHNHNDVGSFIVYADGKPLLIDVGAGVYSKSTFSAERYKQWNNRSSYHNLPLINGVEQMNGKTFIANDVKANVGDKRVTFTLDMAKAYPSEAKVKLWVRKIVFTRGKSIEVTEKYKLQAYVAPTQIILMTPEKPDIKDGEVVLGDYAIGFNPSQMSAKYESIDISDKVIKSRWKHLYRIVFTVNSHSLTGSIKYRIFKI